MTWQEIWNEYINVYPGLGAMCLRLLCAMLVGTAIGMEREFTHRPAGLRTHVLVALGACVVAVLGEMLFKRYSALGATPDPARLAAQVITGVGFLGAGTIMKEGANVKGLTTAAGVWAVACLGLAAGFGFFAVSIIGMMFTLMTLTIFEALQRKLIHHHSAEDRFVVMAKDLEDALALINESSTGPNITIFDLNAAKVEEGYRITFRAWFVGRGNEKRRTDFFTTLVSHPVIADVSYEGNAEVKV